MKTRQLKSLTLVLTFAVSACAHEAREPSSAGHSPKHRNHDDNSSDDSNDRAKPAPQNLQTPKVSFVGNAPRTENNLGVVDTAELDRILKSMGADGFNYIFEHKRAPSKVLINEYRDNLKNYLRALPQYPSNVFLTGFNLIGRKPFDKDYVSWAQDIAKVSVEKTDKGKLANPNLTGFILDDFFATDDDDSSKSFLDPAYLKQVCKAARDNNPNIKIYATVYCGYKDKRGEQQKVFADYMHNNPEISECMTGAYLFLNPKTEIDRVSKIKDHAKRVIAGSEMLQDCMSDLQKGKPSMDIKMGVYISGMSKYKMTVDQRRLNWEYARNTKPAGFVFWMTPNAASSSADAPNPDVDPSTKQYTVDYQRLLSEIGTWAKSLN